MLKIYLFIGKIVGYNILKFLHEQNYQLEFICISSENDFEIIEYCNLKKLDYNIYNKQLFSDLLSEKYETGWLINAWSPHYIPENVLKKFFNNINLHPSFVPYGKGSDSATWAIRESTLAGVSLITITNKLDEGDIYCQKKVNYDSTTTAENLTNNLKEELVTLFYNNWDYIYRKIINPIPQPKLIGSSHKKSETKADRFKELNDFKCVLDFINWSNSHNFSINSLPILKIGDNNFSIELKLKIFKNE